MRCRKVRQILQYHVPNKLLFPEKFAHHVLLLFYPFRDEKELLSGFPPMYQIKLQEEGVQDVANINQVKLEPNGDLVDQAFLQFNENLINNQDTQSQIENDETRDRTSQWESAKLRALGAKIVLTYQRALRAYVFTCQRALRASVLTCQRALRANWQLALRAHVQKVSTGLLFWSKINILPCLVLE